MNAVSLLIVTFFFSIHYMNHRVNAFMIQVEAEVLRLEELKASKMKELVLKKKTELEELRRRTHLVADAYNEIEYAIEAIESGKPYNFSCLYQSVVILLNLCYPKRSLLYIIRSLIRCC